MQAHLAAIGCNGHEISRAHLAAIKYNGLMYHILVETLENAPRLYYIRYLITLPHSLNLNCTPTVHQVCLVNTHITNADFIDNKSHSNYTTI